MRQYHRLNEGNDTVDYKLLIPYKLMPNQVGYVKLHQMCGEEIANMKKEESDEVNAKDSKFNASLELIGGDKAPIKFKFTKNYTDGNMTQTLE